MPTQPFNSLLSHKQKSQPSLLLTSGFSKDTDINIRKNDLFSPTCANQNSYSGLRNAKHTKTDFFSTTNLNKLRGSNNKSEYIEVEEHKAEPQRNPRTSRTRKHESGSMLSSVRYRINAQSTGDFAGRGLVNQKSTEQKDVAYYKRREQELLSEVNHLSINLRQYKELNDELTDKLKKTQDHKSTRYSFQDTALGLGKRNSHGENNFFMEKYHEAEKANAQLQTEIDKLKSKLQSAHEFSRSTNNTESNDVRIKELESSNTDLKRKYRNMKNAYESQKYKSQPDSGQRYIMLYNQECEKNEALTKEIERQRRVNNTDNENYNKVVEELNMLKVKQMSDSNMVSRLKEQIDYEKRQSKRIRENNDYLKTVLNIHGYNYEKPAYANKLFNNQSLDAPTYALINDRSRDQCIDSAMTDRTKLSIANPIYKSIKVSATDYKSEKDKLEASLSNNNNRLLAINIDDSESGATFKPNFVRSSSLNEDSFHKNHINFEAKPHNVVDSVLESNTSLANSSDRRASNRFDENYNRGSGLNNSRSRRNFKVMYKEDHLEEYGDEPGMRNIFKSPLMTSRTDNVGKSESRSNAQSPKHFKFWRESDCTDSFGLDNKVQRKGSLSQRGKRV